MLDVTRADKDLTRREVKGKEEKKRTVTGTRKRIRIAIPISISILPLIRKRAARRTERLGPRAPVPPCPRASVRDLLGVSRTNQTVLNRSPDASRAASAARLGFMRVDSSGGMA